MGRRMSPRAPRDRRTDADPAARTARHNVPDAVAEHRHVYGPVPAASRHTRRIVTAVLVPAAVATLAAMIMLWPGHVHMAADQPAGQGGVRGAGTVTAVDERAWPPAGL